MDKLKKTETIYLNKTEGENLYKVLQNPPKPNKELIDLMKNMPWHEVTACEKTIVELPVYLSQIDLGGYFINVERKFTDEQKQHIKEYFGWDVKDL